jgi:zinc protease
VAGSETGTTASGQAVRATLGDTLRLAADVLQHPAFPADELEQIRRARLTSLQQQRTDPQAVASRTLGRHNNPYPPGDPRYVTTFDEDMAALNAATLERVSGFYREFFGASAAEIAVVGDFDPAEMRALLTDLFGQWKSPRPFTRVPQPFVPNKPAVLQVETPDRANAVLFGGEALRIHDLDPDFPALMLASYMLGDSANSRLMNRLRQKEGVSYSAGGYLQPNPFEANSTLGLYAIFAPENLPRVQAGVREELALVVKDGFNAAEVEEAKRGLLQERRLARAQDPTLAAALASQLYLGRTFELPARIDAAIQATTLEQVNAVVRKYVNPEELALAIAGDFAKTRK